MKRTVFISPGTAEGAWHIRVLSKALKRQNFDVTNQIIEANIIICHSGGFYVLPKPARQFATQAQPELIMTIDIPYWPGKPLIISLVQVIWWELVSNIQSKTMKFLFQKTLRNLKYLISEPLYGWRVIRSMRQNSPLELLSAPYNLVIRNQKDAWCTPQIKRYVGKTTVLELPGRHDDCWHHPDLYVQILHDYLNGQEASY